jgi:hypothetical protein
MAPSIRMEACGRPLSLSFFDGAQAALATAGLRGDCLAPLGSRGGGFPPRRLSSHLPIHHH